MSTRLRDAVVAQHRRLLSVIDRAESSLDDAALRRVRKSVLSHLEAEREMLFPLASHVGDGARYGEEEHLVLQFALERLLDAKATRDRATRIRVLRDLFVHHMERTEWVTLQLLERPAPKERPAPARPAQPRRKAR